MTEAPMLKCSRCGRMLEAHLVSDEEDWRIEVDDDGEPVADVCPNCLTPDEFDTLPINEGPILGVGVHFNDPDETILTHDLDEGVRLLKGREEIERIPDDPGPLLYDEDAEHDEDDDA